jgi:hypothetical protein
MKMKEHILDALRDHFDRWRQDQTLAVFLIASDDHHQERLEKPATGCKSK